MSVKWIYLARRNPRWTPEEFRLRWREHSALAARFSATLGRHFTRVRQCVCVRAPLPADWPWTAPDADGMALLWMRSRASLAAARTDPDTLATMHPDEQRVFADFLRDTTVFAEEQVLLERDQGGCCLLLLLTRAPGDSRAAFAERWRTRHAAQLLALAQADDRLRCYRQNLVFENSPGLAIDGVAELWFETPASAVGFCGMPEFRDRIVADLADFTAPGTTVALLTELNLEKRPST